MTCLKAGQDAPDFTLTTDTGEQWHLAEHRGQTLIMMFHRHLQ